MQNGDTKYFNEAFAEFMRINQLNAMVHPFNSLPVSDQSKIMTRAQEIKSAYAANKAEGGR
jgi:hypothetical protein